MSEVADESKIILEQSNKNKNAVNLEFLSVHSGLNILKYSDS